jgi:hypothetical protein
LMVLTPNRKCVFVLEKSANPASKIHGRSGFKAVLVAFVSRRIDWLVLTLIWTLL